MTEEFLDIVNENNELTGCLIKHPYILQFVSMSIMGK